MRTTWHVLAALIGMASCSTSDVKTPSAEVASRSSARDGRVRIAPGSIPPTSAPPVAQPSTSAEPDRTAAAALPPHLAAADSPFHVPRASEPAVEDVDPLADSRWKLVLERSDATAPRIWIHASGRTPTGENLRPSNCIASRYLRGELLGRSGGCSVSILLPSHVSGIAPALQARMVKVFVADRVCVSTDGDRNECIEIAEWQQADDALVDRVFVAISSETPD